jgi:NADH-quinone oxidoreductase subunit N
MPVLTVALVVLVLSLIGMPPLLGFWSKFLYLFISPLEVAPWLTLVAVVNTGISVGYYGQIIRYIFLTKGNGENTAAESMRDPEVIVVVVTALLTVILGLGVAPLLAPYLVP